MRQGAGTIMSVFTLIVVGIIIADILIHPQGTQAAGQQLNNFWKTTTGALLGGGR